MKAFALIALLAFHAQSLAEEPWSLRLIADGRTIVCRPDGTELTETVVTQSVSRQTLSPDRTRALYVSDGSVHVSNPDGSNARTASPDGLVASEPAWSPDGQRIAFVAMRGEQKQVHLMDWDGRNAKRITDAPHGAGQPKDGRLSYMVYHKRESKLQRADLIVSTDGRDAQVVAKSVFITDHAWSPDGKIVAYGKLGTLVFHELASGKEQKISFPGIDERLNSHAANLLCWRPDSQAVACSISFLSGRQDGGPKIFGDEEVFVIPLSGKPGWFDVRHSPRHIEWLTATASAQRQG